MTATACIRSMTAFARAESRDGGGLLVVEIRSVNSRHLEATFRLPDLLRQAEFGWRDRLRAEVSRGKVEVTARLESADEGMMTLDEALVRQLVEAAAAIDRLARHAAPLNAADLLRVPGVLKRQPPDEVALLATADRLFAQALDDFLAMRAREGLVLAGLIETRLEAVAQEVLKVRERLPAIRAHHLDKLRARLAEAGLSAGNERIEAELVLFAQRIDVAEELDRLLAHLAEIRRVLAQGGAAGRRLDFLMQELNREANTLGSKAVTTEGAWSSVELKVLIEQMREQIQNLE